MESLFNSPAMVKLQELGAALGRNTYLSALQGAMMSLMGVIMVGACFQIVCALGSEALLGLFQTGDEVYRILYAPYNYTMNMLALWVVALISYNYARNLGVKAPAIAAVESLACFMLLAAPVEVAENGSLAIDAAFLGATGMFVGFLVAFVTVRVHHACAVHRIYIRMPNIVPQFLQDGFAGIVPLLLNVIVILAASTAVTLATDGAYTVCSGFLALLGAPLGALTSVPGMFAVCVFAGLMWCFGIHGTMIVLSLFMPISIHATMSNAAAMAAGEPLMFYPVLLVAGMSCCGGTGNTLPLVLMGLRSKSEQIRAVSRAGLVPGWFGINEPVTFGMPIMYNPVLCIPFVLSIPVCMLFFYAGYLSGIITPAWIPISTLLPMGFARYLGTLNIMNAAWDYLSIIPAGLVYYPFFKVYERQLVAREKEERALEEGGADAA